MAAKGAKKVPKKKNVYEMPETIPAGEILTDMKKGEWILGKSIGVGGFGEGYSGIYNKFYRLTCLKLCLLQCIMTG